MEWKSHKVSINPHGLNKEQFYFIELRLSSVNYLICNS